ncbi:phosphoglycerate kinase [Candidatus Bipolaricaulota bacterium]|nr:phosphoglycerate kinase [Candidatus Bipolaricaulota bacterium]
MIDPTSQYRTMEDLSLQGKRVLVRVDFNVPLEDGEVTDDNRIKSALPTINYLTDSNAKVILTSHLGRPGGEVKEELRLDPVGERLSELVEADVKKLDDTIGPEVKGEVEEMEPGSIILLENTRFYSGEKGKGDEFVQKLSELGEFFVNDAFGMVHRKHSSNYGVATKLPSAAGKLILKEVKGLTPAVEDPDHPFVAIIGGKKASSKIGALWDMVERVDKFLIGGALAFTFLHAQGHLVGDSLIEESMVEDVRDFLDKVKEDRSTEVLLPVDAKVSQEFSADGEVKTVDATKIPPDWMGIDIGPATIENYSDEIEGAQTLAWAGPLGGFELQPFQAGTREVAQAVADSSGYRIIGGGETGAAITQFGFADEMDHVSTGGGACLGFLRGKELPALEILKVKNE